MELPEPIYLQSCDECGMPALTYDDQGNARCVKHATVFIPAADATSDDEDDHDETYHPATHFRSCVDSGISLP